MDITNCRGCGRLFNYISGEKLCPECRQKMEDKFQEVKEYVRANPNSGIEKTARELDVPVKQIHQWIREERLVLSEASADGIVCESCGKPILTGRYCQECKYRITNGLMEGFGNKEEKSQKRTPDRDRMRFLK